MSKPRSALARTCALLLGTLACACGDDPVNGLDFAVDEPGPFAIGYREITVTYQPPADALRTITVAIWYPVDADVAAAIEAPEYAFYTLFPSFYAIVDAPAAPPVYEGGYPVIVHSHGATSFPGNSYLLAEAFASHGFVVAAPRHVGDTLQMSSTPVPLANRYERPLDVSATLDALATLPEGDPLAGRLVTERAILTGHSRGSFTVWAALGATFDVAYVQARCDGGAYDDAGGCPPAQIAAYESSYHDPRFVGAIPMAGSGDGDWFGGAAGMNGVTTPILMMTGSDDPVGADALWQSVTAPPMTWIDIAGGCHQLYGFGRCPNVSDDVAQPIIAAYAIAFARRQLFADDDPTVLGLLDGTIIPSDIVTIETR